MPTFILAFLCALFLALPAHAQVVGGGGGGGVSASDNPTWTGQHTFTNATIIPPQGSAFPSSPVDGQQYTLTSAQSAGSCSPGGADPEIRTCCQYSSSTTLWTECSTSPSANLTWGQAFANGQTIEPTCGVDPAIFSDGDGNTIEQCFDGMGNFLTIATGVDLAAQMQSGGTYAILDNGSATVASCDNDTAACSGFDDPAVQVFRPQNNEPPSSSFATLDTRNSQPILVFVDASDTCAVFSGVADADYAAGTITVNSYSTTATDTSGNPFGWCVAFERVGTTQDVDSDSFATAQCASTAASATSGILAKSTITFTQAQADSLAAGEPYRLQLCRDGDGSSVTDSNTDSANWRMLDVQF